MSDYRLEKAIWSDADFEQMGWHDTTVWAMAANPDEFEFMLDLDYIFKWVHPEPGEKSFKFWVAPVTMVFENAWDLKLDIESSQGTIEVMDLQRTELGLCPRGLFVEKLYRFECGEGEISLKATGYKLYVREPPQLLLGQAFTLGQRDGVSFDREPGT